ncbi:M3 family oligoendopeptidase [Zavarzinia sp. CC-PAN008]|uniref:M3 family oligoendopeptidase n=1 Tax=Zavarzinia sp. CC-PAN008 TaxID=3243332 RepID=UPI003F746601
MSTAASIPAVGNNSLGPLPSWDLSDLYPGMDAPELERDFVRAHEDAKAFRAKYEGRLASMSGAELGQAVAEYEKLQDLMGRIGSYASLVYAADMSSPEVGKFQQGTSERLNETSLELIFFTLELNKVEDEVLAEQLKAPELAHYAPWIREARAYRPHQLSDEVERLLHEKYVAGRAAWTRLFDETMAALRFPYEGRELTSAEALHLMSDRDPAVRAKAAASLSDVFAKNVRLFALITNTLVKDKEIDDRWRKYPQPASYRHLSNSVEPEVVDALSAAVQAAFPQLSHRYYALKAKWFGVEKLNFWDRNAPLPEDSDRTIPWAEATRTVLDAYHAFSPELAQVGKKFFDNAWIDAPVRPGKAPGAFAHPTVPSAHPYLLVNYQGKTRDVMTLAHELGHGVHQVLAADQGTLMADTPLTLAETASVFGEMLTFQALLKAETDPGRRRILLASKVEDMINTVVRQIAFYEFERRVHDARRKGELTPDQLGQIWYAIQSESLGPAIDLGPGYENWWVYIPHFVHTPFYVYAYAFGDCLVNSLYSVYEQAEPGFQQKYLDMLKAGGTLRHKELLAPFRLDATDPAFWARGLSVVSGLIDQLEALSAS